MFWLAASVGLSLLLSPQGALSPREQAIWRDLEPSIVFILDAGEDRGVAALIDTSGLFITSKSCVSGSRISGRTSTGKNIRLRILSEDRVTQMILLQSSDWDRASARPFSEPSGGAMAGDVLFAVQSGGPQRVELVATNRIGVSGQSRRLIPLMELRGETQTALGTNVLVVGNGELYGMVTSTLGRPVPTVSAPKLNRFESSRGVSKASDSRQGQIIQHFNGPGDLMVAYVPGEAIMRRVLSGFLSPTHRVVHPFLGVYCRDSAIGGALVESVVPGSAAQTAGVRVGDTIIAINSEAVTDQIGFAQVMFRQRVGEKITILVRRGTRQVILHPSVGHETD